MGAPPSQAGSQAPSSQAGSQAPPSQAGSQIQSSQYDHRPPPETAVGPQTDSQIGSSSEGGYYSGYYSQYGLTEIPEETDTEKKRKRMKNIIMTRKATGSKSKRGQKLEPNSY